MATQLPEVIPVPMEDPIEIEINQTFSRLIHRLNQRRINLLNTYRDKRDQLRADQTSRVKIEQELDHSQALLENAMTHNMLHSMRKKLVTKLKDKKAEIQVNIAENQEFKFLCDTRDFETNISRLGEIEQIEIPPHMQTIPVYATFQQPIVVAGKKGSAPGEFESPAGVTVQEETGHIYVSDMNNHRVQIFSETGEHLNHFGDQHLMFPMGILIHQDDLYITDIGYDAIFRFGLPDLTMIIRVGAKGPGKEEFNTPRQLAISPNHQLYVADQENHRLQILNPTLAFQDTLLHQTMTRPVDVKFSTDQMFVLSRKDNPCVHIFTLSGEKISSIITRGTQMEVSRAYFFCLDDHYNIIISDGLSSDIKVFSPEGDLLHTLGEEGHEPGKFYQPTGISILKNTKLVIVSQNINCVLQIFS